MLVRGDYAQVPLNAEMVWSDLRGDHRYAACVAKMLAAAAAAQSFSSYGGVGHPGLMLPCFCARIGGISTGFVGVYSCAPKLTPFWSFDGDGVR